MLSLSVEQMERFARTREEKFLKDLTEAATAAYPELAWMHGPQGLELMVRSYVKEGEAFGLSYESTLCRYTYWRLDHGDALLCDPAWEFLRLILRDETLEETEKADRIDSLLYGGPALR